MGNVNGMNPARQMLFRHYRRQLTFFAEINAAQDSWLEEQIFHKLHR
jgi:hypothetical protein